MKMVNHDNINRLEGYGIEFDISFGLLLGSIGIAGITPVIISILLGALLPNSFGIIVDSPCNPGSDAAVKVIRSYVILICTPYLSVILVKGLKATISSTSLHKIVVYAWLFLSKAFLWIGYMYLMWATFDSLKLALADMVCATYSKSFGLAVLFGLISGMVPVLFRMRHL